MSDAKIFVKVPGIRGTGKGRTHQGWIEGTSMSFDNYYDVKVGKLNDSASVALLSYCVDGRSIEQVILEMERNGSVMMRAIMDGVQIASWHTSYDGSESVQFNFETIKWSYFGP